MNLPTFDWQFWIVTACAALAAGWLGRGFLPGAKKRRRSARKATLTVAGKPLSELPRLKQ